MSVSEIDVDQLAELLAAADGTTVTLIDVREHAEYEAGHVPGAVLVPLATVPDQLGTFSPDGTTYLICAAGGRSARAAEFAAAQGLDVVNVAGGTNGWVNSGRAVVSGPAPT